jgi:MoaA/NifB/PqqE/SkfB family radical SAM enzyme
MNSKTFCPLLWNHQFIDGTGRVKPCCRFSNADSPEEMNLKDHSFDDIFYGDWMNTLRDMAKKGDPISGCVRCYEEEQGGKKSLRERMLIRPDIGTKTVDINTPVITNLEMAISNDCNLMCRMCDSRFSYKLYDEEVEFKGEELAHPKRTKVDLDFVYKKLSTLKYLKFTGGEPLTIKDHWDLLEYAVEQGYSHNIILNYSTNGTVWPKEKIVNLWSQFKRVELCVSFDSVIKEENEYLRHLTNQESVIKNIDKYLELSKTLPIHVISRPTITVLNMYHLPETIEFLETKGIRVNPTHLTKPDHLSVTILPKHIKEMIKDKFNNYIYKTETAKTLSNYLLTYMLSADNSNLIERFKRHTDFLDKKRNQSFKNVYPYYDF